jgi:hypothetical protein
MDRYFLVFVITRPLKNVFDLGCGEFIELIARGADKGEAEDHAEIKLVESLHKNFR